MSTPLVVESGAAPTIDGYQLRSVLGRGGFATVYKAIERTNTVAVKIAHRRGDERMQRERVALAQVGSPAAPEVLAWGTVAGRAWIAMELIDGVLLSKLSESAGPRVRQKRMLELCEAVSQAHQNGVIHRDLKPENIMWAGDRLVLLDFGIARFSSEPASAPHLTRTGARMGSPLYMAPEMWADASTATQRTDVYSLGVIAFELWTGRPPFGGDVAEIRQGHTSRRPPIPSALTGVPSGFDAIISRCLRKDPQERYATVAELKRALVGLGQTMAKQPANDVATKPKPLEPQLVPQLVPQLRTVLAVKTSAPLAELIAVAAAHGAVLARANQQGPTVFAFPNPDLRAAVGSARRCASSIPGVSGWHLDVRPLEIRKSRRGLRVLAEGLDRIEVEAGETTSDRAQVFALQTRVSLKPASTEIVGRDLEQIVEALRDKQAVTIVGASGLGKSRVATDVARLLRSKGISCAYFRARSSGIANPDALIADVLRTGFRSEAAIEEAFSDDESGPRWAARHALGYSVGDHELLSAPGARRGALTSAIERALEGGPLLILDDAQWADPALLDAISRCRIKATANLICVSLEFLESRPSVCTQNDLRVDLDPLSPNDAKALTAALLSPIEFVSAALIERISNESFGIPQAIIELCSIVLATAVQTTPGEDGLVIASDYLPDGGELGDKLARRLLDQIPAPLMPLFEACIVLESTSSETLETMIAELADSDPLTVIDPGTGLARLVEYGALMVAGDQHVVRSPILTRALSNRIDPARRQRLHRLALSVCTTDLDIARHAAEAGDRQRAASTYLRLGNVAIEAHQFAAAEWHYTSSLDHQTSRAALTGRGRVRYRLQRFEAAVDDLQKARAGATAQEHIELLLEEATCRDWCQDWETSAHLEEQAADEYAALDYHDAELSARLQLARARSLLRIAKHSEALAIIRELKTEHYETRIITNLLGGFACIYLGLADDGLEFLNRSVASARKSNDDFHLAAALTNRQVLTMNLRSDVDAAMTDVSECIVLGKRLGNPQLERGARHNLAEMLFWTGDAQAALPQARRGHELQQRFVRSFSVPDDALLLARILSTLQEDEALEHVEWIHKHVDLSKCPKVIHSLLELVNLTMINEKDDGEWERVADDVREQAQFGEYHEVLIAAAESACRMKQPDRARAWLAKAVTAGAQAVSKKRIQDIEARLREQSMTGIKA